VSVSARVESGTTIVPETATAAGGVTATVTSAEALVEAELHESAYCVDALAGVTDSVPEMPRAPDQPPLAVHPVAFAEDHVRVTAVPGTTLVALAVSDTVGGFPPPPEPLELLELLDPPLELLELPDPPPPPQPAVAATATASSINPRKVIMTDLPLFL
jgi:hypothetical protein